MDRFETFLVALATVGWAPVGYAQTAPAGASAASAPGNTAASAGQWYSYDAATNTVTFKLEAGAPGRSGPFNFNGYTNGAATLVVPANSKVVMSFVNDDGTPHSAVIIADTDPMPSMGGDPAIPRAYTKDLTQGMAQGGTDVMKFTTPASGTFRISCGVPGHGLSGMWIRMKVDPSATTPSWIAP
ncbi:MAG TPA: sulfocyanin-like copper-binding protein [Gemmatimonadales bacterium]